MSPPPPFDYSAFCTLSDLVALFKKARWRLAFAALLGGGLTAGLGLMEPTKYTLEASFREKNSSRNSLNPSSSSLSALLLSGVAEGSDSSAISTLKSRQLLEELITTEGLQGSINPSGLVKSYWEPIRRNLLVEYARWTKQRSPILSDPTPELRVPFVGYDGEVPVYLQLAFEDTTHFHVKTTTGTSLGRGELDLPFYSDDYNFIISATNPDLLPNRQFDLTLLPLSFTARDFSQLLTISADKDDKSLLVLKLRYSDRICGARCLNTLMYLYQEYLHSEHQRFINEQLEYLQRRQSEVNAHLQNMMRTYADNLSQEFSHLGFLDTQRAMEFLSTHQHAIKSKQLTIDLEIKRLQQARADGKVYFDTHSSSGDTSFLHQLLLQIRDLKQQHDSIQVTLDLNADSSPSDQNKAFEQQIEWLTSLQSTYTAADDLLAQLETDNLPKSIPEALQSPKYMVAAWHAKLLNLQAEQPSLPLPQRTEWQDVKNKYLLYLRNLRHNLQVHSKALEENLAHQQNTIPELQGINLHIAKDLFLAYSKASQDVESKILQHTFVIEQLQQPQFEISSLCAILDDPVSRDIAANASELAMAVKDQTNRSQREVARLEDELGLQRSFLTMHLTQAKELLKLHFNLMQKKQRHVQLATLALLQQQISVTQHQLDDYIAQRIDNLQQELALLVKQQDVLQGQMQLLPDKWVDEQLIYQQMELNRQMGREITNLVESKNISSNLEIVQSAPVDSAIAPLHPDTPRTLLLFLMGAVASVMAMSAWTLLTVLCRGISASSHNLRLAGATVITMQTQSPQATLQRLVAQLLPTSRSNLPQSILIANQSEPTYGSTMATFLASQGYKVVLLPLPSYQYTLPTPLPQSGGYDLIPPYIPENTAKDTSPPTVYLQDHLKTLSTSYDWVLVNYPLPANDPNLLLLLDLFDRSIIYIQNESLPSLQELLYKAQQRPNDKSVLFLTQA